MDKYVVRQAIKRREDDEIVGYEIMIQSDNDSLYNASESAVADTISGFLTQNNDIIFKDKPTFLSFPPSLFFRNTPRMFEKEKLVIQVDDSIVIHPLASTIMQKYRRDGYRFAINNFQFSPKYFSLLEMADYAKVDLTDKHDMKGKRSLINIVDMLHGFKKKCIAMGVNTKEDYDLAKDVGVDFLEGNYIERATITKSSKMDYLEGNFFHLVVEVTKDEPDVEEIEKIISRDASLSYAILKMVNSKYFAARKKTSSIRQALVTLGISQLRQWAYLLSVKDSDRNNASEEVLKLSFLRATLASALVGRMQTTEITRSEGYMIGMFSTMDYIIDATMEEILEGIPLPDVVKDALIRNEGIGGELFQLILDYEQADWKKLKMHTKELHIQTNMIAQLYMDCVEEVNEIWNGLTSEFERPEEEEEEGTGETESLEEMAEKIPVS